MRNCKVSTIILRKAVFCLDSEKHSVWQSISLIGKVRSQLAKTLPIFRKNPETMPILVPGLNCNL
jgi:hypothetical protein